MVRGRRQADEEEGVESVDDCDTFEHVIRSGRWPDLTSLENTKIVTDKCACTIENFRKFNDLLFLVTSNEIREINKHFNDNIQICLEEKFSRSHDLSLYRHNHLITS